MQVNNFKRLQEEDEREYEEQKSQEVHNSIWQTLGLFKFVGEVTEVYLPRLVDMLVAFLGGTGQTEEIRPPSDAPSLGRGLDPRSIEPGAPDEEELDDRSDED